jgi:hypothetical protein
MDEERLPAAPAVSDHQFLVAHYVGCDAGAFLLVVWVATKALFFFL